MYKEKFYIEFTINTINDFKKYCVYDIANSLFRENLCDGDVAQICAWWVYHNQDPKSWQKYFSRCSFEMNKRKKYPTIHPRFIDKIFDIYKFNKFHTNKIKLF